MQLISFQFSRFEHVFRLHGVIKDSIVPKRSKLESHNIHCWLRNL